jgi:hypothetical protein
MLRMALWGLTLFLLLGTIIVLLKTIQTLRQTAAKSRKIETNLSFIDGALKQIQSSEPGLIIAGLQTLSVLNHPRRLKALPRVLELAHSEDQKIASAAKVALTEMHLAASDLAEEPLKPAKAS